MMLNHILRSNRLMLMTRFGDTTEITKATGHIGLVRNK